MKTAFLMNFTYEDLIKIKSVEIIKRKIIKEKEK